MTTDQDLRLLALCSIPEVNWHVIAREASRHGIERLLSGHVGESSRDGERTRKHLEDGLPQLETYLERAHAISERAASVVSH